MYFKEEIARYRDIAIDPKGGKIYLAVDSSSKSSGLDQHYSMIPEKPCPKNKLLNKHCV